MAVGLGALGVGFDCFFLFNFCFFLFAGLPVGLILGLAFGFEFGQWKLDTDLLFSLGFLISSFPQHVQRLLLS